MAAPSKSSVPFPTALLFPPPKQPKAHSNPKGTYDPIPKPSPIPDVKPYKDIKIDTSRAKYWLGVGAQPSEPMWRILAMVCNLIVESGVGKRQAKDVWLMGG